MKLSTIVILGVATLALLLSPMAYSVMQSLQASAAIHQSHMQTGGQTVVGVLNVRVGQGDANNCNKTQWLGNGSEFVYRDGDAYKLNSVDITQGAGKGYQCAIEDYNFNDKHKRIIYKLNSDKAGNYIASEPFDQNVNLQ